jgi:CubicO group peptidase (beta-lactamase class C family)
VIQRATRTPVDRYIESRILAPLGITRWQWPYSPSGETMTGGGLRLTSRDLAKLAWMVANGGRWRDRQIVPASWIAASLTARRNAYPGFTYGYFYWSTTYRTRCGDVTGWYMAGNGGNAIVSLPELHAAVVVTRTNYNTRGMHQQTIDLLQTYVLPALLCHR